MEPVLGGTWEWVVKTTHYITHYKDFGFDSDIEVNNISIKPSRKISVYTKNMAELDPSKIFDFKCIKNVKID